jgi:hypothetical protein
MTTLMLSQIPRCIERLFGGIVLSLIIVNYGTIYEIFATSAVMPISKDIYSLGLKTSLSM